MKLIQITFKSKVVLRGDVEVAGWTLGSEDPAYPDRVLAL